MAWLEKVRRSAPDDLRFVIEDITDGDPGRVGVMWHVEVGDGTPFPFSRGCSFLRLDASGRICYVRDVVEPATKPGDATLSLLGVLAPLVRKLGPAADPANLGKLPLASAALWALYAGYTYVVMLSTWVPGPPALATPPEVLLEVFHESVNIFWVNDALTQLHLSFIPNIPSHPVSEAVFNFVIAWALLCLPLLAEDPQSNKIGNKAAWFTGILFLTNVFFIPFMALRAAPEPPATDSATPGSSESSSAGSGASSGGSPSPRPRRPRLPAAGTQALPPWAALTGAVGAGVGVFAIAWALTGRPELGGDLADRAAYFQQQCGTNRVFWAFILDCALFYAWQLSLMAGAPPGFKYVPMFGMAAFLITGGSKAGEGSRRT